MEERQGNLFGYEIKWAKANVKAPTDWKNTYPGAGFEIINKGNYLQYIQ